ncbi:hypothetical protein F5887DRAFT_1084526 [Amanita rubescens]|nr:hypothetical protein F5887DRAFT_1089337 [Amanita rubescens]KAF8326432.1 hypothetical protein F5887DRAFT_1084526 [Amanita rubescens]
MPPRVTKRAPKKVISPDFVEFSDAEQPSALDPAASRSPTKATPAKRKTRKSSTTIVQDGDSSPDVPLSHQIKKPRVATPQPSPRAASLIVLESDDGDQGGSPSPPPKRSRRPSTKSAYMSPATKGLSGSSKGSSSMATRKQLVPGAKSEKASTTVHKAAKGEKKGRTTSLPNTDDATPDTTNDGDADGSAESDSYATTIERRRPVLHGKGKGRALTPVHAAKDSDSGDVSDIVDQLPSPAKVVKRESEDEPPFTPMASARRPKLIPGDASPSPSMPAKCAANASRSRSQILYPAEFRVPADSDYDDQEDDFEPVDTDLMPLIFQDMKLRLDYVTAPPLVYAEMHSTNQSGNNHQLEMYTPVWAALKTEDDPLCRRRFRNAVRFQSSGPYINPARASTDLVARENGRIVLANTGAPANRCQNAVLLTTGVVTECQLITPGYFGSSTSYLARRISIYPLHTEHQRAASFIGNVLNHATYLGPLYNGVVSFSTRRDGPGGSTAATSTPATPTRRGRPALKLRQQATSTYPGSRGFNEAVPIYDARGKSDWTFTAANIAQLAQLPLYKGGASDPPPDSLVTVGYAVGEYTFTISTANYGSPVASHNVLFVIVIGDLDRPLLDDLSERLAPCA